VVSEKKGRGKIILSIREMGKLRTVGHKIKRR
jgi:hypothetical protein